MSPLSPGQPWSSNRPVSAPPWWISSTIAFAPAALSPATSALAVSASSVKRTPATPAGVTSVAVAFSVMPMKPMRTPPTVLIAVAGKMVLPLESTTLAAR